MDTDPSSHRPEDSCQTAANILNSAGECGRRGLKPGTKTPICRVGHPLRPCPPSLVHCRRLRVSGGCPDRTVQGGQDLGYKAVADNRGTRDGVLMSMDAEGSCE
jgi:hypothetical protein